MLEFVTTAPAGAVVDGAGVDDASCGLSSKHRLCGHQCILLRSIAGVELCSQKGQEFGVICACFHPTTCISRHVFGIGIQGLRTPVNCVDFPAVQAPLINKSGTGIQRHLFCGSERVSMHVQHMQPSLTQGLAQALPCVCMPQNALQSVVAEMRWRRIDNLTLR